jgi:transposase
MRYSGLVSSEHSSGNRIVRGGITKTGNAHLRRVVIEAAWAYQHRPNICGFLLKRQKALQLDPEIKAIAWKAQMAAAQALSAFGSSGQEQTPNRDRPGAGTTGLYLGYRC